jgi:hypothetical protein
MIMARLAETGFVAQATAQLAALGEVDQGNTRPVPAIITAAEPR